MEHPKCKLCGTRHASWEPHQLNQAPQETEEVETKKSSSADRVKRWRKKHPAEYNAKMREYRKRRKYNETDR